MTGFKKFWYYYFKYVPPFFLLLLISLAIYGYLNPWSHFEEFVEDYPNSFYIHSGAAISYYSSKNKGSTKSKDYILIDKEDFSSKSITIKTYGSGEKEILVEEGGFGNYIFQFFIIIFLIMAFWFFKITHNKSKQSDAQKARTTV